MFYKCEGYDPPAKHFFTDTLILEFEKLGKLYMLATAGTV